MRATALNYPASSGTPNDDHTRPSVLPIRRLNDLIADITDTESEGESNWKDVCLARIHEGGRGLS